MIIRLAQTDADILKCTEAILLLRPHHAQTDLLTCIKEMQSEGYKLAFVEADNKAVAICGYRYLQFLYCGKHIYIDDLSTLDAYRHKGYAAALLDFVEKEAQNKGYSCVTLDSGHQRTAAHRLYLNKKYTISAHHFTLNLKTHN